MEEKDNNNNNNLFDDFSINDLFKKIYLNHNDKETIVKELLEELKLNLTDVNTAFIIGPIVKDLADSTIKNDELLIKLANVATKIIEGGNKRSEGFDDMIQLSSSERSDLINKMKNLETTIENE